MEITILTSDDEKILTLNVNPSITVEDLKLLMEVETSAPRQQQQMMFDGKEMKDSKRLRKYGVSDGDSVVMNTVDCSVSASSRISYSKLGSNVHGSSNSKLGFNIDGSAVNPSAYRQHILKDYDMMARIYMNDPELAETLHGDDLDWLQLLLRTRHSQRAELQRRQVDAELALLHGNQSDPEVRKKMEAAYPRNGVIKEWDADLERIPRYNHREESPYIDAEINGVPLKALLDTGAEISAMSESCAKRCGLWKLIDTSDKRPISGVGGEENAVGQINIAPIKIGNMFFLGSFTVLQSVTCIFGMDLLRRNQCVIDTTDNVLRIRGEIVVRLILV